ALPALPSRLWLQTCASGKNAVRGCRRAVKRVRDNVICCVVRSNSQGDRNNYQAWSHGRCGADHSASQTAGWSNHLGDGGNKYVVAGGRKERSVSLLGTT